MTSSRRCHSEHAAPPPGSAEPTRFKALGDHGQAIFGGRACWDLPGGGRPGAWMPPVAHLCPSVAGYHLAGADDLVRHWLAPRLFVAQGRGGTLLDGSVLVCREARLLRELSWDQEIALRFYRDCLAFAVGEALRHGDFVDACRHQRMLDDARFWRADPCWHDALRLELADLATALGGVWHRAARRRAARLSAQHAYVERARDWQVRRFLGHVHCQAPRALEEAYA